MYKNKINGYAALPLVIPMLLGSMAKAYDITVPILGSTLFADQVGIRGQYRLSSTTICDPTQEEMTFITVVATHFVGAKACWKMSRIPTERQINRIIAGCIIGCRRQWPGQPEYLYRGFGLIISETGGNNIGNPNDPSYGVCCACYESSHHACHVFGYHHPYRKQDFIDELKNSIAFNVQCAFGELALCDARSGGDWVRTVLMYKMGITGLSNAVARNPVLPLTEFSTWKSYSQLYMWLMCLRDRIRTNNSITCGCAAAQDLMPLIKRDK